MPLWTIGYGAWPAATRARLLVDSLRATGITRLVDVRLNPCASDPIPGRPYGPKAWNLQAGDAGIVAALREAGIAYEWLVELGNPQRQDGAMTILHAHLADPEGGWPVHRGLALLADRVREPGARVAILCACKSWRTCHRTAVAEALRQRHFGGGLVVENL
jgi:uncharacterized protein (DUF488 family)